MARGGNPTVVFDSNRQQVPDISHIFAIIVEKVRVQCVSGGVAFQQGHLRSRRRWQL